jgi:leucyl aminopeptidase (aminopeptidase T)
MHKIVKHLLETGKRPNKYCRKYEPSKKEAVRLAKKKEREEAKELKRVEKEKNKAAARLAKKKEREEAKELKRVEKEKNKIAKQEERKKTDHKCKDSKTTAARVICPAAAPDQRSGPVNRRASLAVTPLEVIKAKQ